MLVSDSMTARQVTFFHKLAHESHAKLLPNERITRSEASSEIDALKNNSSVQCSVRLVCPVVWYTSAAVCRVHVWSLTGDCAAPGQACYPIGRWSRDCKAKGLCHRARQADRTGCYGV